MNNQYRIHPLGDRAIIIEWEQQIDPAIHYQVMKAFRFLQSQKLAYILDLIPAYASLAIVYDTILIRRQTRRAPAAWLTGLINGLLQQAADIETPAARTLEIPVCYDPSLGPDINTMAQQKEISIEQIVELHTQQRYTVYMLGFLPGFPYMGKVPAPLVTPRLKQPRLKVPAGSVGIAGEQTGIYPLASPGGWNIIGQTPLRLFDAASEDPCYCRPGDQVQFVPVSLDAFHQMQPPL